MPAILGAPLERKQHAVREGTDNLPPLYLLSLVQAIEAHDYATRGDSLRNFSEVINFRGRTPRVLLLG